MGRLNYFLLNMTVLGELPATFEVGPPAEWDKANALALGDPTLEGFGWLLEHGYLDGAEEVLSKLIETEPGDSKLVRWQRELDRMRG